MDELVRVALVVNTNHSKFVTNLMNIVVYILEESKDVAESAKLLVLQPMTAVLELREYLVSHNFSIVAEYLEAEDEKLYNIIVAKLQGSSHYTKKELYLGKGSVRPEDRNRNRSL